MKLLKLSIFSTILFGCAEVRELPTVDKVDLEQYAGTWYEIERFPNSFEKGLKCVTANYALLDNGKIRVLNKGIQKNSGKEETAKGKAKIPDPDYPGRLKVSFFWPFAGDYYIMRLDDDYQYVLVGSPSRKYLWILSRTKQLDEEIITDLRAYAESQGFDTSNLVRVEQDCP